MDIDGTYVPKPFPDCPNQDKNSDVLEYCFPAPHFYEWVTNSELRREMFGKSIEGLLSLSDNSDKDESGFKLNKVTNGKSSETVSQVSLSISSHLCGLDDPRVLGCADVADVTTQGSGSGSDNSSGCAGSSSSTQLVNRDEVGHLRDYSFYTTESLQHVALGGSLGHVKLDSASISNFCGWKHN